MMDLSRHQAPANGSRTIEEENSETVSINESIDEPDAEDMARFAQVLATINLDRLPELALSIRRLEQGEDYLKLLDGATSLSCPIPSAALFGGSNILFTFKFTDGTQWVLRVPAIGVPDQFDEFASRDLRCEALTMQLLKRETTIPIPKVFSFSNSCENDLGCPYILMEFIDGIPLYDCWFDKMASVETLERRRAQILEDVAAALAQLSEFSYNQSGSLLFNELGEVAGVGPRTMIDPDFDDPDEHREACDVGPFNDPKSDFLFIFDRLQRSSSEMHQGMRRLLRLFVDWIPFYNNTGEPSFVLNHPELEIENFIVSPEGKLLAIVDWNGVKPVPCCVGNLSYPSWLTRDWDRASYAYGTAVGSDCENSPEELARYREMYLQFLETSLRHFKGDEVAAKAISWTRNSLLIRYLSIAANRPSYFNRIMHEVFERIVKCTQKSKEGPDGNGVDDCRETDGAGNVITDWGDDRDREEIENYQDSEGKGEGVGEDEEEDDDDDDYDEDNDEDYDEEEEEEEDNYDNDDQEDGESDYDDEFSLKNIARVLAHSYLRNEHIARLREGFEKLLLAH